MTLPTSDTVVLYPLGAVCNDATVLHIEPLPDGRAAVLLDRTSVHPVDAAWPDQGPDRAVLRSASASLPVLDCVVGASDGERLVLGGDVPRPGTEGWAFLVVHVVEEGSALGSGLAEGSAVSVEVDAEHRRALSLGHTACHLASLALNAALADRWTKQPKTDALGRPDFDKEAIESSVIVPWGSRDRFRLNKSLRRKGFAGEGLGDGVGDNSADGLAALGERIDATLAEWVESAADVRIERDGDLLTDRRYWVCELPEGTARIACGGTHATSLAELESVRVGLAVEDDDGTPVLVMTTAVAER
jgi:alanyl-tRNA synthetase